MKAKTVVAVAVLLAGLAGCTNQYSEQSQKQLDESKQQVYGVPAQQLFDAAKRAVTSAPLSLPIEQDQNGVILTGYKEGYRGDWHIARYWQERTRYRLAVIPDWTDPTHKSRLEVTEETQTRSNSKAPWQSDPSIKRPDRALEVTHLVQQQLLNPTPATQP
jgi:hypothetical protein